MPLCHFFLSLTKQWFRFSAYFLCELMSTTCCFVLPSYCVNQININLLISLNTVPFSHFDLCPVPWTFIVCRMWSRYATYKNFWHHSKQKLWSDWYRACIPWYKISITCYVLLLFICLSLFHTIHIYTKEFQMKQRVIYLLSHFSTMWLNVFFL